jgi:hypothetical protein
MTNETLTNEALRKQLNKRLNTDKLIASFIRNVKEDVETEYPDQTTEILGELEGRLFDIADEYMSECILSQANRRQPRKEDLWDQFDEIYLQVISDYSTAQQA